MEKDSSYLKLVHIWERIKHSHKLFSKISDLNWVMKYDAFHYIYLALELYSYQRILGEFTSD